MKIKLTFKEQRPNSRAHYSLFAMDTPFKPKSVKRKDLYKRKPKHKNNQSDQ